MRLILIALIALMPTVSWASCGPVVEFEAETEREYGYGSGTYFDGDRNTWDREREHTLSLSLSIPLNDIECRVKEADKLKKLAEARDKRADAMDQRLRNFQRILDICEQDENLPICVRLPVMSQELGLE